MTVIQALQKAHKADLGIDIKMKDHTNLFQTNHIKMSVKKREAVTKNHKARVEVRVVKENHTRILPQDK